MEIDTTSKFLPPKSLSDTENSDQVSIYLYTHDCVNGSIMYVYHVLYMYVHTILVPMYLVIASVPAISCRLYVGRCS